MALKSLQETFITVAQSGPIWLWPVPKVLKRVQEVEGYDVLKAAHSHGKGLVVVSPHLGSWEFVGLYLARCGLGPLNALYQPPKAPALDQFIIRARSRAGNKVVPTNLKGIATIMAALRKGEITCILPDQVPAESGGKLAHFFGVQVLSMSLLTKLLQKTGAKVVFAAGIRVNGDKGDGFKIILREASDNVYAGHMQDSIQAINDDMEALIKEVPEQYQWEYKRFKRLSKDEPKVY